MCGENDIRSKTSMPKTASMHSRRSRLDRLRTAIASVGQGDGGWGRCCEESIRDHESRDEEASDSNSNACESMGMDGFRGATPRDGIDMFDSSSDRASLGRRWDSESIARLRTGVRTLDERLDGGLVHHGIHELIGDAATVQDLDSHGNRGRIDDRWIPHLGPACSLSCRLSRISRRREGRTSRTFWIGRRCRPGPWMLTSLRPNRGGTTKDAIRSSWFIRPSDAAAARRWCVEQAIDTEGADLVVADGSGFSTLDTRRLQVAMARRADAGRSPVLVVLCRPASDWRLRSAATTRWHVESSRRGGWRIQLRRWRAPQRIREPASPLEIVLGLHPSSPFQFESDHVDTTIPVHRSATVDGRSGSMPPSSKPWTLDVVAPNARPSTEGFGAGGGGRPGLRRCAWATTDSSGVSDGDAARCAPGTGARRGEGDAFVST